MSAMSTLRRWATPVTIASFAMMAVTGVLMFFHAETTLNKVIHEYASWIFVIGAGLHVVVNWRAFTVHFRRWPARISAGLLGALLVVSFLPIGPNAAAGPRADRAAIGAMVGAPLSAVARLTGEDEAALVGRMRQAGYDGAGPNSTIRGLSGGDKGRLMGGISLALTPPTETVE
ncbi:DUF4405 domain-containing protein [Rhodovulum sp. DZ06]|uniref:DUF4405 domain-containing protein n=1 Tax=Rhodovulum sp. DZ06 TaxID=3425126 RepID=UPI003D33AA55